MICPACQHENREGRRFCGGCGDALQRACPSCGAADEDGARFCGECGAEIAGSTAAGSAQGTPPQAAGAAPTAREPRAYTPPHLAEKILTQRSALEGERKQVTVLFADVKGSVELSGLLDPEEWHGVMDRFLQILADGVHRFEGTVNQYTGDGIMALFGAPIAHEDHAQRACFAGLFLMEKLREYTRELKRERGLEFAVRMGINSGDVVVGKIGDDLRMDYTAQGQTVGLAQRMESVADPGCICVSEMTSRLVSGYFDLEELGEFRVKGVAEPVPVRQLRGIGSARTRLDISRARGFSKFVGRDAELAGLKSALARVAGGQGEIIGVVAEAGTGKSRLCFEFEQHCKEENVLLRKTTGRAHGRSIPLLPVMELFRDVLGIQAGDDEGTQRQKIAGGVVLIDAELSDELPLFLDFMGVPDPKRPAPVLSSEARMRRIVELVKRFSMARGRMEPAVILFEDLHWVDPATDQFVQAMAEASGESRTLLLVNFRPEYRADWMHRSNYQQLALRPLDREAIDELLGEWLGDHPSLAGLSDRILERTGGTPFFIEEVVQSLLESGTLEGVRGRYSLAHPVDQIQIPATVESLLAARIDRLGELEKEILQTAAVIGREFAASLLERVSGRAGDEVAQALRSLVQREFLFEQALYPDLELAFKHPLTQEVAFTSQLRERRQRVHGEVAKALEELHADEIDEKSALLAHHWEGAGDHWRAVLAHARAAHWSGGRHTQSTLDHFERMRDLLADLPESDERNRLLVGANAQILLYGMRSGYPADETQATFRSGCELARRTGDERGLALLLNHYGYASTFMHVASDGIEGLEEALEIADRIDDRELKAVVRYATMTAKLVSGRYPVSEVRRLSDEAWELIGDDDDLGLDLLGIRPKLGCVLGRATSVATESLRRSREEYERILAAAEAQDDTLMQVIIPAFLVMQPWCAELVSPEVAMRYATLAMQRAEVADSRIGRIMSQLALGMALMRTGRVDEAVDALEAVHAEVLASTAAAMLPQIAASLAEALSQQGNDRAHDLIGRLDDLRRTGWDSPWIDTRIARALRRLDGAAAADRIERVLDHADQFVDHIEAFSLRPVILEERAELAALRGDDDARRDALERASDAYERLDAPDQAARLRSLL
ncbi:MAG: AAA family ATPase [Deltaproteobacteria bacterium]|nr:AAA family ATPase [Deltaproteobacteria bacterium]